MIWAQAQQNQQNDLYFMLRLWSAWPSAQSDQPSLLASRVAKYPNLEVDGKDWSDWALVI